MMNPVANLTKYSVELLDILDDDKKLLVVVDSRLSIYDPATGREDSLATPKVRDQAIAARGDVVAFVDDKDNLSLIDVHSKAITSLGAHLALRDLAIADDASWIAFAEDIDKKRSHFVVVDRTGLTGNWQFVMTFAQERRIGPEGQGEALPPPDPNAPSFFTALQEQLGLKLESTKAPFDVTVIDSVEHPTED